jgi:hypothetical protein
MPAAPALGSAADAMDALLASRAATARATTRRPVEPDPSWMEHIVPPLQAPAPLVFDSIQPIELSIAPMTVDPLVTEPLVIPPMTGGPGLSARY